MDDRTASARLKGLILDGGWRVKDCIASNPSGTGGTASYSYVAEKDGRQAFLKAFDFSEAFEPHADTARILNDLAGAYDHERDVLEHCRDRKLSKVVISIGHGYVQVPDMAAMEGRVAYVLFEMADGDVRCQMDLRYRHDLVWCMHVLRDISLALFQVHREMIAHQDPKPSNVLHFAGRGFKLADFGRSSRKGRTVWYDARPIAGDRSYAPPELLYGFTHPDFAPRRMGCDIYMLGNLAAFLFSGQNVTSMMMSRLDPQHHFARWPGTYAEVLPYLETAFAQVLVDIEPLIDPACRDLVIDLIRNLCTPSIAHRGHPKGVGTSTQYSLERYVSVLTLELQKLEIRLRVQRKSA